MEFLFEFFFSKVLLGIMVPRLNLLRGVFAYLLSYAGLLHTWINLFKIRISGKGLSSKCSKKSTILIHKQCRLIFLILGPPGSPRVPQGLPVYSFCLLPFWVSNFSDLAKLQIEVCYPKRRRIVLLSHEINVYTKLKVVLNVRVRPKQMQLGY